MNDTLQSAAQWAEIGRHAMSSANIAASKGDFGTMKAFIEVATSCFEKELALRNCEPQKITAE